MSNVLSTLRFIKDLDARIGVLAELNGEPLEIAEDGYIGEAFEGELHIQAVVPENVHGVIVNRQRYAEFAEFTFDEDMDMKVYDLRVQVKRTKDGKGYTVVDNNSLRLVTLSKTGYFKAYQVTIVGQRDKFWLIVTKGYDCRVYRNPYIGLRLAARCNNWRAHHVYAEILGEDWTNLPPKEWNPTQPVRKSVKTKDLKVGQARVVFFGDANGIGLIEAMTADGVVKAKVYWGDIRKRKGTHRQYVQADEKITFDLLKRPHDSRRSKLEYQVVGVRVVEE